MAAFVPVAVAAVAVAAAEAAEEQVFGDLQHLASVEEAAAAGNGWGT